LGQKEHLQFFLHLCLGGGTQGGGETGGVCFFKAKSPTGRRPGSKIKRKKGREMKKVRSGKKRTREQKKMFRERYNPAARLQVPTKGKWEKELRKEAGGDLSTGVISTSEKTTPTYYY